MIEKSIILFRCKSRLNSNLPQRLISDSQKIYIVHQKSELKKYINEKKNIVVVYDKKNRDEFLSFMEKFSNKQFYSLIIMSNNEARKFNFKKHQNEKMIYISNPANIEELSQFIELLFKIELMQKEISDSENIIQAFEKTSEFSRQELMEAYEDLQAQEKVSELSRKELIESQKSLKAWETVSEFSRKETIEKMSEFEALDKVLELSRQERVLAETIISAWEKTMELGRGELKNAYDKLQEVMKEKKEVIEKMLNKIHNSNKKNDRKK